MHPPPKYLERISEFQYQRYDAQPVTAGNNHPEPGAILNDQISAPPPTATVFNVRLHGITPPEYSFRPAPAHDDSILVAVADLEAPLPPMRMDAPPSDYDNAKACFVCWDAPPDAVLLECGHSGLCVACAERLWQRGRGCPLCRAGFAGVVRIVDAEAAVVRTARRPGAPERKQPRGSPRARGGRVPGEEGGWTEGRLQ